MKAFEYAAPAQRSRKSSNCSPPSAGTTEVLAGGTDLMRPDEEDDRHARPRGQPGRASRRSRRSTPTRRASASARWSRSTTCWSIRPREFYPALRQAIGGIGSMQTAVAGHARRRALPAAALLVLPQRPAVCWPIAAAAVAEGDNRFHAIFGNAGPAKFVCPSRLAPALIALGATRAHDRSRAGRRNPDAAGAVVPHAQGRARARARPASRTRSWPK